MSATSSSRALRGWLRWQLGVLLLALTATATAACPLCYEAARRMVTIGQQIDAADRAVLASPVADGNEFRIVEVIKGGSPIEGGIASQEVDELTGTATDEAQRRSVDPVLLVHIGPRWLRLGSIKVENAEWLRKLAATQLVKGDHPRATWPLNMQTSAALSDAGWRQRVSVLLPYLESSDPLAAQIAWGELARAPYAALSGARSRMDPKLVRSWLDDPRLAARHAAYTLLLGFIGAADDAAWLEQRIEAASSLHDATDLAAMIGADLELRGPPRVDWVEAAYFTDRKRTLPEIEAALLALNVHGDADHTVPRARVVQAYRFFIKARPPMAGFVAPQLADWGCWDAVPDYAALLKSNAIKDPASELAVASYLQRAAAAKAALQ